MSSEQDPTQLPDGVPVDLHDDGLLWLINAVVFHPRGFALARLESFDGDRYYLLGDGTETWRFDPSSVDVDDLFARAEAALRRAAEANR